MEEYIFLKKQIVDFNSIKISENKLLKSESLKPIYIIKINATKGNLALDSIKIETKGTYTKGDISSFTAYVATSELLIPSMFNETIISKSTGNGDKFTFAFNRIYNGTFYFFSSLMKVKVDIWF